MKKINITLFCCLLLGCLQSTMAQNGGGVWLDDGASCIGSVVSNNRAKEGFGVAGRDGVLLNATVVGNVEFKDTSDFIHPGYIYCEDGVILSKEEYTNQSRINAIGMVFWVNSDVRVKYPKGAVIAFDQKKKQWGTLELHICKQTVEEYNAQDYGRPYRDTACYGNTIRMNEMWDKGRTEFEAGNYCWTYLEGRTDRQWCMLSLLYLRRMYLEVDILDKTIAHLNKYNHQFELFSRRSSDFYWSSSDNASDDDKNITRAFCVRFYDGQIISSDGDEGRKKNLHWVRPMFLY